MCSLCDLFKNFFNTVRIISIFYNNALICSLPKNFTVNMAPTRLV
ncbi:hypothetical protein D1BOALGB6SA_529 [Olavius sp. associated proteobacterium Delta 1]|nr:hypothetical protein D1BOALGB6SA_529 [Olavius sp. associated proteobacterium Delta 1]